jgi:hypothetical protein
MDQSGWSVSLDSDGDRVAIGAYQNDGNGSNAGHVRIYEYSNSSWTQLGSDIDGEALDDESGYSVSWTQMVTVWPLEHISMMAPVLMPVMLGYMLCIPRHFLRIPCFRQQHYCGNVQ